MLRSFSAIDITLHHPDFFSGAVTASCHPHWIERLNVYAVEFLDVGDLIWISSLACADFSCLHTQRYRKSVLILCIFIFHPLRWSIKLALTGWLAGLKQQSDYEYFGNAIRSERNLEKKERTNKET